jgi:acetyl-CoA synthetase
MAWHVIEDYESYETARADFEWEFPDDYNPAVDCLQKHEDPGPADRTALVDAATGETYTYRDVDDASSRLANALDDADVRVAVFDPGVRGDLAAASRECPALDVAVELDARPWYVGDRDGPTGGSPVVDRSDFDCEVVTYESLVADRSPEHDPYDSTPATDTAVMYTSGSTGPPKGVLHSHALWAGRAAAAMQGFDPGAAFDLLETCDVTGALAAPTALRMMRNADPADYDLSLSTVASAGEPVTPEILAWADEAFDDLAVNEYYGQTELNLVVANASRWFETRPGSSGTDTPSDSERVLHIRFRRSDRARIEETLRAVDRNEDPEPYFECTFDDPDQLHRVTRPTNLELLRTIAREEPGGIRETARLVDRDVRQVHRNLAELEALGLVDLEDEGRSKRPRVWYDTIEVDLPLLESDGEYDTADS